MSNRNTTYKQTSIGLIPMDWELKKLGEIFQLSSGKTKPIDLEDISNENNRFPVYGGNGIMGYSEQFNSKDEIIIIGRVGENCGVTRYINELCWITDNALYTKNFLDDIDIKFLAFKLQYEDLAKLRSKGGQPLVSQSPIYFHPICYPKLLSEQQKIAKILSTWDTAIGLCKFTLGALLKRKKWLASELLSNKKVNANAEKVKNVAISKLVNRIKNQLSPEPEKLYKQIGIRSHCKGIFYKEEVTGKSLGNKSVFYIEPNCFIVNIVFAWEHAIAKTTNNEIGMIASHRFPMFRPKEGVLDLNYMLHFFKSKKGKDLLELASPGGAGRNKTLGQSEFLKLQIPVPGIEKQKVIAEVLDKADYEILLYQQKLQQLQLQKKGLMHQLLTGKTRVKTD